MKREYPLYSDPDIKMHPNLIQEADHVYFDDEPTEEEKADKMIADKLWLMISQLAQVKSPLAHTLLYVLTGENRRHKDMAQELGVSERRFNQLLKKTKEDLKAGKQYDAIGPDEEIRFKAPCIKKRENPNKYIRKDKR